MFLFDLYDSVDGGKSGERKPKEESKPKMLYQVLYGYVNTLAQSKRGPVCSVQEGG